MCPPIRILAYPAQALLQKKKKKSPRCSPASLKASKIYVI